jgi:hypothetical protein
VSVARDFAFDLLGMRSDGFRNRPKGQSIVGVKRFQRKQGDQNLATNGIVFRDFALYYCIELR